MVNGLFSSSVGFPKNKKQKRFQLWEFLIGKLKNIFFVEENWYYEFTRGLDEKQ